MTVRIEAMANQVADAFLLELRKISKTLDAGLWLSDPKTIRRGMLAEAAGVERPALLITVADWRDTPLMGERHEVTMRVDVHCIVEGDELAEVALNRLAADVVQVIAANETLRPNASAADKVTFAGGATYTTSSEIMARAGLGIATVSFEVLYQWSHGAP